MIAFMKISRKASITPFLSLVFLILMSFIFSMLQLTDYRTSCSDSRRMMESAIFSVFGEFQRELYDNYGIFALDGGYHGLGFQEDHVLRRLNYYGSQGIESSIQTLQLLTDQNGQAFKEQVLDAMEAKYGLNYVNDFLDKKDEWGSILLEGEKIMESGDNENRELDQLLLEEELELPEEDNPLPELKKMRNSPILSLVLPKGTEQSKLEISLESQVSKRTLRQGYGETPTRGNVDSLPSQLLLQQFMLKNFTHALSEKEENEDDSEAQEKIPNQTLQYELEYIIAGRSSDIKNLESVISRIFLIRLGINYAHVKSCKDKVNQARALAIVLAALARSPQVANSITQVLLASWAFAESIIDLRSLMKGNRVAIFKTDDNWYLQLSNIGKVASSNNKESSEDDKGGIRYSEYLRILLMMNNQDHIVYRTMDRVEENIKIIEGHAAFRMDAMIYRIHLDNKAEHAFGTTYEFPTQYGYH